MVVRKKRTGENRYLALARGPVGFEGIFFKQGVSSCGLCLWSLFVVSFCGLPFKVQRVWAQAQARASVSMSTDLVAILRKDFLHRSSDCVDDHLRLLQDDRRETKQIIATITSARKRSECNGIKHV